MSQTYSKNLSIANIKNLLESALIIISLFSAMSYPCTKSLGKSLNPFDIPPGVSIIHKSSLIS
jgi:hypothetical protein